MIILQKKRYALKRKEVLFMKANEVLIGAAEVQKRLRRSERISGIVTWLQIICLILFSAGLLIRIVTEHRHGFAVMMIGMLLLLACSFLQIVTNNKKLRTCACCGEELSAKEILSEPADTLCCPHCGKPFQAKINPEEFNF